MSNQARLFILDDGGQIDEQSGEHFQVESSTRRYPDLIAKYDRLIELANEWGAEAYAIWDDDDLYLPWHLSAADWAMSQGFGWSYPQWVMSEGGGKLEPEMTGGNLHGSLVIGKEIMERVEGWPKPYRADFDLQFIGNLLRTDEPGRPDYQFPPSYVFRWPNSGARHLQNFIHSPSDTTAYARNVKSSEEVIHGPLTPCFDCYTTWFRNQVIPQLENQRCVMPPRKVRREGLGLWARVGEIVDQGTPRE